MDMSHSYSNTATYVSRNKVSRWVIEESEGGRSVDQQYKCSEQQVIMINYKYRPGFSVSCMLYHL